MITTNRNTENMDKTEKKFKTSKELSVKATLEVKEEVCLTFKFL